MKTASVALGAALVVALVGVAPVAAAAKADPLFESNEPMRIRITAPLREMARDRNPEPAYRDATMAYTEADGSAREMAVRLRPRGKSRRNADYCQVPPLRLNLAKDAVKDTTFHGQRNLKLVTHCRTAARHDNFIYKEYLIYRMLNQVTDDSYRVRPLEIEYVDVDKPGASEHRFGFVIEHKGRMARRLGREESVVPRLAPQELDAEHASLMDLFQYMIANTDWSFISPWGDEPCCHNTTLLSNANGRHTPMPYDFDVSGFVNAPYAVVDGQLPISDVRQRLFRGFCRNDDSHVKAVQRMQAARPAIFEVLNTETMMDDRVRKDSVKFIEGFYKILDDPKQLQRRVLSACRKV